MLYRTFLAAAIMTLVATPGASKEKKEVDRSEMVCRRDIQTNTRFTKRICHTRDEWEAIAENAKRDASKMINRPAINPVGD